MGRKRHRRSRQRQSHDPFRGRQALLERLEERWAIGSMLVSLPGGGVLGLLLGKPDDGPEREISILPGMPGDMLGTMFEPAGSDGDGDDWSTGSPTLSLEASLPSLPLPKANDEGGGRTDASSYAMPGTTAYAGLGSSVESSGNGRFDAFQYGALAAGLLNAPTPETGVGSGAASAANRN